MGVFIKNLNDLKQNLQKHIRLEFLDNRVTRLDGEQKLKPFAETLQIINGWNRLF